MKHRLADGAIFARRRASPLLRPVLQRRLETECATDRRRSSRVRSVCVRSVEVVNECARFRAGGPWTVEICEGRAPRLAGGVHQRRRTPHGGSRHTGCPPARAAMEAQERAHALRGRRCDLGAAYQADVSTRSESRASAVSRARGWIDLGGAPYLDRRTGGGRCPHITLAFAPSRRCSRALFRSHFL